MAVVDDVVAVLEADTGAGKVATVLSGGIYTYEELGRLGLNRDSAPSAFNSTTGQLKPCCVVKGRAQVLDGGVYDDGAQDVSYRQVVELWFYDAGTTGWDTLYTARDRAFTLLHGKTIGTDKRILRLVGHLVTEERDMDLGYAAMLRSDYEVRGTL